MLAGQFGMKHATEGSDLRSNQEREAFILGDFYLPSSCVEARDMICRKSRPRRVCVVLLRKATWLCQVVRNMWFGDAERKLHVAATPLLLEVHR